MGARAKVMNSGASNGTAAGTTLVKDIRPGSGSSDIIYEM